MAFVEEKNISVTKLENQSSDDISVLEGLGGVIVSLPFSANRGYYGWCGAAVFAIESDVGPTVLCKQD